jgi:hypothetical protein
MSALMSALSGVPATLAAAVGPASVGGRLPERMGDGGASRRARRSVSGGSGRRGGPKEPPA